jgi:hypothetical protein
VSYENLSNLKLRRYSAVLTLRVSHLSTLIEASSKASVKTVDLPTLEAQAVSPSFFLPSTIPINLKPLSLHTHLQKQLEQANEMLEQTNAERLQRARERFAALKRGEQVSLNGSEDEEAGVEAEAEAGNERRDIVME